jgi:hypothetical protein
MSCRACYEATVSGCSDIKLIAGLESVKDYFWVIKKANSRNIYQRRVTTDSEGALLISKSEFPLGFFSEGNFFNLQVKDGDDYLKDVPLKFGEEIYDCVLFKTMNYEHEPDDNSEIDVIQ